MFVNVNVRTFLHSLEEFRSWSETHNAAGYTCHKHVPRGVHELLDFQHSRVHTAHEPRDINMVSSRRVIVEFVLIANGEACLKQGSVCAGLAKRGTSYVAERVIIYLLDGWRARRPVRGCENELRPAW